MSGDEIMATLVSLAIAVAGWTRWYWAAAMATTIGSSHASRLPLYFLPPAAIAVLYGILRNYASHDVVDAPQYLFMYTAMGAAWVIVCLGGMRLLGVSTGLDAIERRNPSAAFVSGGLIIGATFCFAGGNIGNGPGWWVVVFCAILASGTLLGSWGLIHAMTGLADAITIDRDPATGVRHAGFLAAAGLILGRSVAGDWVSAEATVQDFVSRAWPVLFGVGAQVLLQWTLRPTDEHPRRSALAFGLPPALVYLLAAVLYVRGLGSW